jgi:hypothetical protein
MPTASTSRAVVPPGCRSIPVVIWTGAGAFGPALAPLWHRDLRTQPSAWICCATPRVTKSKHCCQFLQQVLQGSHNQPHAMIRRAHHHRSRSYRLLPVRGQKPYPQPESLAGTLGKRTVRRIHGVACVFPQCWLGTMRVAPARRTSSRATRAMTMSGADPAPAVSMDCVRTGYLPASRVMSTPAVKVTIARTASARIALLSSLRSLSHRAVDWGRHVRSVAHQTPTQFASTKRVCPSRMLATNVATVISVSMVSGATMVTASGYRVAVALNPQVSAGEPRCALRAHIAMKPITARPCRCWVNPATKTR